MLNSIIYSMDVSLLEMLKNAKANIGNILDIGMMIIGMGILVYAVVLLVKSLRNPQQASWGMFVLALVAGGFLTGSGFTGLSTLSSGATETMKDLTGEDIQSAPQQTILVDGFDVYFE